jgi:hypothetical protein
MFHEDQHFAEFILSGFIWYGVVIGVYAFFELEVVSVHRDDIRAKLRKGMEGVRKNPSLREEIRKGKLEHINAGLKKMLENAKHIEVAGLFWTSETIPLADESAEWQELSTCVKFLRNKLAHEAGEKAQSEEWTKVALYVKKMGRRKKAPLKMQNGRVVVTPEYCVYLIGLVERYFRLWVDSRKGEYSI